VHFEQCRGVFQSRRAQRTRTGCALSFPLFILSALGLNVAQVFDSFAKLPGETIAIHAQVGDGAEGVDDVECDGGFRSGRSGGAGEQVGFEGRHTVEPPSSRGEFLHELLFGRASRLVLVEEFLGEALIGGEVLRGQSDGAAGESVAQGVERRTLLAGWGAGSGGEPGVGAVDGGAVVWFGVLCRGHGFSPVL
jgi:hypothetical protein